MSSENKVLALFEKNKLEDQANVGSWYDTDIIIKDHDTEEVIFRGRNKVIIPGSGAMLRKLFDTTMTEVTPTYNTALNIPLPADDGQTYPAVNANTSATVDDHKVLLFCVGTDGCGTENSQVYSVDYRKWIAPESLIPFRYPLKTADLVDDLRKVYFGRVEGSTRAAYYFKRFDTDPVVVQQYVDGTPIDANIYTSAKADKAETYVELVLKVTRDDVREWFIETSGINSARVNTISLCTCYPVVRNGKVYWQDIRPITKLNIPNEPLIDITKGIDIYYHIYF